MEHPKRHAEGSSERLGVLRRWFPSADELYASAANLYMRKHVALDDINDAMVAAVAGLVGTGRLIDIPEPPETDPTGLPTRSGAALSKLLEHPKDIVELAPWLYEPRTKSEASVGCGLAYSAAIQRFGSFTRGLGTLVEYCEQDFSPWVTYLSYTYVDDDASRIWKKENGDWIDYIAFRLLGIE